MKFKCFKCGHTEDASTREPMCSCGGLWTLDYRAQDMDMDSLDRRDWSLFRYKNYLGFDKGAYEDISLGEGMTPVVKLADGLYVKLDYLFSTLSYKDRGAAVLISHAKAIGVDRLIQDSSGNAGNAVAAYAARAGIECEILVPEGTSQKKIDMIKSHGATCTIVPGDRDNTARTTLKRQKEENLYYASHVYNPIFYQGTKTYIYEVYEQMARIPESIFVPIGNGTLFLGLVLGLEDMMASGLIDEMPHVIGVQSQHADPIYQAYKAGKTTISGQKTQPTLAEGIAIGEPRRAEEILSFIYKYDMEIIQAREDKILDARADLARRGLYVEHTTAAIYAAYLDYKEERQIAGDSLISLTGAGLKSD